MRASKTVPSTPTPPCIGRARILRDARDAGAIPEGWRAADLHVHTFFSYDVIPVSSSDPLRLYEKARQRGLHYLSFTDHDTMDAYDRVGWQREGLVPGVEIKILDRKKVGHTIHVNVFLLDRRQFGEMKALVSKDQDIENFLQFVRAERLPVIYNHPFWFERGEKPNVPAVFEIARLFPVIEYNRGRIPRLNRLALEMAERHGKGMVACSDTHTGRNLGAIRTHAPGESFREYFENVSRGQACLVAQDMTIRGLVEEANEGIRQFFGRNPGQGAVAEFAGKLGPTYLRWLVRLLARDGLLANNRLRRTVEGLLYALSNTAVIQSHYIRSQESLAVRIAEQFPMS
ncbi:MAG: PHP-associated domain-containing protein [bacterium]